MSAAKTSGTPQAMSAKTTDVLTLLRNWVPDRHDAALVDAAIGEIVRLRQQLVQSVPLVEHDAALDRLRGALAGLGELIDEALS